jgi:hypothetical protein
MDEKYAYLKSAEQARAHLETFNWTSGKPVFATSVRNETYGFSYTLRESVMFLQSWKMGFEIGFHLKKADQRLSSMIKNA